MKRKKLLLFIAILTLICGSAAVYYISASNKEEVTFGEEEAKYKTRLEAAPTDGTIPSDHNSYDNIAYVLHQLKTGNDYTAVTRGSAVSVGQTQDIYNRKIKNGDTYLVDTVSSGLLEVGKQKYFKDNVVLMRNIVSKDGDNITWEDKEPMCLTYNGYIKMYGSVPTEPCSYIICEDTILSISDIKTTEDGLYSISIDLNPDGEYAPFWYKREITMNSSSLSVPEFLKINVEYVFNEKWEVQRIRTQEEYKVTPKVAPVTVACKTDITEEFDYENHEFPAEDMAYFEKYKDLKPAGDDGIIIEEEEAALSYITGSLMAGGEKTFDLNVKINEQAINGKVALDISNLENIKIKLGIDKLQVVFQDNTAYIDLGSTKLKANVNDIMSLIGSISTESAGLNLDVDQIMNDLNNANITETDTHVLMDVKLNLLGIELPITFKISKTETGYDMESISAKINIADINIELNLNKNTDVKFNDITGEYNDIANLDYIFEDVAKIINNKYVGIKLSLSYEGIEVSGDVFIDFKDDLKLQANLVLDYPEKEITESLVITYISEQLYIDYEQVKVMLPISSLSELIDIESLLGDTTSLDINSLLPMLFTIDYATIIDKLIISENGLFTIINLSQFLEIDPIELTINNTDKGITIGVDKFDVLLDINTIDYTEIITPTDHVNLTGYVDLVKYVMEVINKESLRIELDANINVADMNINVNGNIDLVLNDTYQVNGILNAILDDITLEIGIILVGNELYVTVLDKTIKIDITTIGDTINSIMNELGITMDSSDVNLDINSVLEIVDTLLLTENSISVDLTSLVEFVGVLSLSFVLDENLSLDINSNNINVGISVETIEAYEIVIPTEYITEEDILNIIPYIKDVMDIINNKYVGLELSLSYEDLMVNGTVYLDFNEGIKAHAVLDVKYQDINETVEIYFIDNTVYVSLMNMKIYLPITEITELIPATESNIDIDINGLIDEVKNILGSLEIKEDRISLGLSLSNLLGIEQDLDITLIDQGYGFDLSLNLLDLYIKVDTIVNEEIVTPTDYVNVTGYVDLVKYVIEVINKESLRITLDGEVSIEDINITLDGNIDLVLNDAYQVNGTIDVVIDDITLSVGVILVGNELYVSVLDKVIKIDLNTIGDTIETIMSDLGISLGADTNVDIDINSILSIVDTLLLTENSISVDLTSLVEFVGVLSLSFVLDENLSLDINSNNINVGISVETIEAYEIVIPTEYITEEDILNIIPYIKDVMDIINNKYVGLELSLSYEDLMVNGTVYLDFNEGIKAHAVLDVKYQDINETVEIYFIDNTVYVSLMNMKIYLPITEITELIPATESNIDIDINGLIDEVKNILGSLEIKEDRISLGLSLSNLLGIEQDLDITLIDQGYGFDLSLNLLDLYIKVDTIVNEEIVTPTDYVNVTGYVDLVKYVMEVINKESLRIELDGEVSIEDINITLDGNLDMAWSDGLDLSLDMHVEAVGVIADINITLVDNVIYLSIYDNVIALSLDEIESFVNDLLAKFDITLDETNVDLGVSIEGVLDIVKTVVLNETAISVDLSSLIEIIGILSLEFVLGENNLDLVIASDLFNLNVKVEELVEPNIVTPTVTITKDDMLDIAEKASYIYKLINNESIGISLDGSKVIVNDEELLINGYINLILVDGRYDIDAHLSLNGFGIYAELDVKLIDNVIYLSVLDNTFKISLDNITNLINEVMTRFDLAVEESNSDSKTFDLSTLDLHISSDLLSVDLTEILNMSLLVSIVYSLNEEGFNSNIIVEANDLNVDLSVKLNKIDSYQINVSDNVITYEDLLVILDNAEYVYNLIESGKIHIDITDVLVNINEQEIRLNGSFDLLLGDEFGLSGVIHFEGFGIGATLGLTYSNDVIYLNISNQTIGINLSNIESFIDEVIAKLEPIIGSEEQEVESLAEDIIDLNELMLIISSESIIVDLEHILDLALNISIYYGLSHGNDIVESMDIIINGDYNNEIIFTGNVALSQSEVNEIIVPSEYLNENDILELIDFVVVAYGYKDKREFEVELGLNIYTNGELFMEINGSIYLNILEDNEFDLRIKAIIDEYSDGEHKAWHQVDISVISLTTLKTIDASATEAMMYGYYGNNEADPNAVLKIKSTFKGITDLIEKAIKLLNINVDSSILTVSEDVFSIDNVLSYLTVSESVINIGLNGSTLFEAMKFEEQVFDINIIKNEDSLVGITGENIYVSYTNKKENTKLDNVSIMLVDTGMSVVVPSDVNNYYDISNISYLVEALYNNATQKEFRVSGDVTLTAIGFVSVDVPLDARVLVDENGMPEIFVTIDMSDLGIGSTFLYEIATEKMIYIYYKDEYVYIHRDDLENDKDDRMIKIHYTELFDNIVYYLLDYAMGLNDDILGAIYGDGSSGSSDGFVDASKCITSVNMTETTFKFGLDMVELTGNSDLGPIVAELGTTMVAKKDENGNYEYDESGNIVYSPMIYKINEFSFELVGVINLHSESLTLSNVYAGNDGVVSVQTIDMSKYYSFVTDFDNNYNADEEYIYSNGKWVSNGKLSHRVIFNMDDAGMEFGSYKEGQKIGFPTYKDNVVSVEENGVIKYYKIIGWYKDKSYLDQITDFNIYMKNSTLTFYALVEEVTVNLTIYSEFNDVYTLTTYEGNDISDVINNIYNIYRTETGLYKFKNLNKADGSIYDMSYVILEDMTLYAEWEYVEYDFYAYYNDQEILLDDTSSSTFTTDEVVVYVNNTYYIYSGSKLTHSYIVSSFASLFTLNDEDRRFEIVLYTVSEMVANGYHSITFDTPTAFNNKDYKGVYIKDGNVIDVTKYTPNKTTGSFEINAWVLSGEVYLSMGDIKSVMINQSYNITPYVSTKSSLFTFALCDSGVGITGYSGTDTTVIFPRYALIGSDYYVVSEITLLSDSNGSYSAFTGNTTIQTVVFNEGLKIVCENAFKNCSNLREVYFSSTVTSVAGYSFYMDSGKDYEANRDICAARRFYIPSGSGLSTSEWAAAHHTSAGTHYYGDKGKYLLWTKSYDYSQAFQTNNYTAFTKSLEIARSL